MRFAIWEADSFAVGWTAAINVVTGCWYES